MLRSQRYSFVVRYFDATRLIQRGTKRLPTGVDRVDLAYLSWLQESGKVGLVINRARGCSHLEDAVAGEVVGQLSKAWSGVSEQSVSSLMDGMVTAASPWRRLRQWWCRRGPVARLAAIEDLEELAKHHLDELDPFDPSWVWHDYPMQGDWSHLSEPSIFFGVSHSLLGRTAYLKQLARCPELKRVFFIHDLIPCDHPEFCRPLEGHRHLLRIRNALRYGTHLIANSNYTRDRLEHWRVLAGLPERSVEVIPIGLDERVPAPVQATAVANSDARPYFVMLGTVEPRKNHLLLLRIWQRFVKTLPKEKIPVLKVIGASGWENDEVVRQLDGSGSLEPHVEWLRGVGDEMLWKELQGASAMLFPSKVEGWGMPLVEALAMGVPVIASDISAFDEAGAGVPDRYSVDDDEGWAQAILDYAGDGSEKRQAQISRLQTYQAPSWQEHFNQLEAFVGADELR